MHTSNQTTSAWNVKLNGGKRYCLYFKKELDGRYFRKRREREQGGLCKDPRLRWEPKELYPNAPNVIQGYTRPGSVKPCSWSLLIHAEQTRSLNLRPGKAKFGGSAYLYWICSPGQGHYIMPNQTNVHGSITGAKLKNIVPAGSERKGAP